jgi:hypothetical protein
MEGNIKTITIHLHNGEQLLLVGVPMDANNNYVWGIKELYTEAKKELASEIFSISIIGTWIPRTDVIDFEVQDGWIENISLGGFGRSYEEWKNYTGQAILTSPEQSFLSLLKSHTKDSEVEKFCVLKIEKK